MDPAGHRFLAGFLCRAEFSAVKGIFESVLRWKSVNVRPTRVEVCRPVPFHRYTTNYGGPLRASDAFAKGASFQFYAVVLVNVCYRLYGRHCLHPHAPTMLRVVFDQTLISSNN